MEVLLVSSTLKLIHDRTVHQGRLCIKNYRSVYCTEAISELLTTFFLHFVMFILHRRIVQICALRRFKRNAVRSTNKTPMNYNEVLNAQAAFVNHSVHRERDVDCFCVHVLMLSSSSGKLACDKLTVSLLRNHITDASGTGVINKLLLTECWKTLKCL